MSLARFLRERQRSASSWSPAAEGHVDRVVGLEVGADDYVAKPFDPRELRARLKSVLRRLQARRAGPPRRAAARAAAVGRCALDLDARSFSTDGGEIAITAMEFDLLKFRRAPEPGAVPRQLLTLTRNREWEPFDRSIDIRIARLRRKMEADPDNPRAIRTVRGAGYMFVPASVSAA